MQQIAGTEENLKKPNQMMKEPNLGIFVFFSLSIQGSKVSFYRKIQQDILGNCLKS